MQISYLGNIIKNFNNSEKFNVSLISYITLLILLIQLFIICSMWSGIHVWRHDSAYYYNDYWGLMVTEGRWLNYLFFNITRRIPAHFAISISLLCFSYFFYKCASQFLDNKYSLIFALASLNLSPIYDLLGWPTISLNDFVLLAIFAYVKNKYNWLTILIFSSILFHGCINSFYNLIPLLYLNDIYRGKIKFVKFIAGYIGCYILGFLVMELIVIALTHGPMIILRHHNYINSIQSVIANIKYVYGYFKSNTLAVDHRIFYFISFISFLMILLEYYIYKNKFNCISLIKSFVVIFCLMLAPYAQAIPFGLYVSLRTSISTYAGLLACIWILAKRIKILSLAIMFIIIIPMFNVNIDSLNFYKVVTNQFYINLKSIDIDPELYKIYFISNDNEVAKAQDKLKEIHKLRNPVTESLHTALSWPPAAYEAGFGTVLTKWNVGGNMTANIPDWLLEAEKNCKFEHNEFYRWCVAGDWLIIGLDWPKEQQQ